MIASKDGVPSANGKAFSWPLCFSALPFSQPPGSWSSTAPTFMNGPRTVLDNISIDLIDAFHPQTILAHSLNDAPLSTGHGAPLRLRVERQLGYKHAKYVMRIELTDQLGRFGRGRAGFGRSRVRVVCGDLNGTNMFVEIQPYIAVSDLVRRQGTDIASGAAGEARSLGG